MFAQLDFQSPRVPKHRVFISFHHVDDLYRQQFEKDFSGQVDGFICRSVQDGDINPRNKAETIRKRIRDQFISDSTVTVELIGAETWRRKHIDWEIGYSLTQTTRNYHSGLIGILLPSYTPDSCCEEFLSEDEAVYTPCNIPPRLYDNVLSGYAKIYAYPQSALCLKTWIHEAYKTRRKRKAKPINQRHYFKRNIPSNHANWKL